MIKSVHHIGIVVRDLEEAIGLYERRIGLRPARVDPPPGSSLCFAMVRLPGTAVELIAPTGQETPVSGFLNRRGPGLHHVAFQVSDIRLAMAESAERGLEPLSEEPQAGVGGHLTCFFHPKHALGVLIEYVQEGAR